MTHERMRERLIDLAYGELAPHDAREVEEHVASCEACGSELARIRGTRRIMASLPQEAAPERGEAMLLAAAREAVQRRGRRAARSWIWAVSLAASLALVAGVAHRIIAARPRGIAGEDPNALMGEARYPPPAARGAADEAPRAEAVERERTAPKRADRSGGTSSALAPAREPLPQHDRQSMSSAAPSREPPRLAATPAPAEPLPGSAAQASPGATRAAEAMAAPEAPPIEEQRLAAGKARPDRAAAMSPAPAAPAVQRYEELRRTGKLREEVRTFPGCAGELWRKLERDPDGRVVSYTREEITGEWRVRVEAIYGLDGHPVRVAVTDAISSAPVEGVVPWIPSASDADGPGRCRP